MKFIRGADPKNALDIGMSNRSLPIFNLALEIRMTRFSGNGYSERIDPFRLKLRKIVSLKRSLYILNKENLSFWDLIRNFRIISIVDVSTWENIIHLWKASRNSGDNRYSEIIITHADSESWRCDQFSVGPYYDVVIYPIIYSISKANSPAVPKNIQAVEFRNKYYPIIPGSKGLKRES